jgi:hypothetical protein
MRFGMMSPYVMLLQGWQQQACLATSGVSTAGSFSTTDADLAEINQVHF